MSVKKKEQIKVKMLSDELLAEIREIRILLVITAGVVLAVIVKCFIKGPGIFYELIPITIFLLSMADLLTNLYGYKKLYREVEHEEYASEVKNRIKYQCLVLSLKRVEDIILICVLVIFCIGFVMNIVLDRSTYDNIEELTFAAMWVIWNRRHYLWKRG